MRVAIVGAGYAGLSTARMLLRCGFQVTVFEQAPDVGGVWSRTRRYPGLRTQNDKRTYAFSELPMPAHYPQWPSGEQVQQYLESYAAGFGLSPALRLSTRVVSADLEDDRWTLTTQPAGRPEQSTFDHLVIANGIFSRPAIPVYPGRGEFEAAGGKICAAQDFADLDDARGRHVVVVGYGKSACDVAVAISDVARSTAVVARRLLWKMPRRLARVLNYKYLLLTRMGEGLFPYIRPTSFEKFLHARNSGSTLFGPVQHLIVRQLGLQRLGLVPHGPFSDIARSTVSLVTEGFFERVADGRLRVHRDAQITELCAVEGRPSARLATGHTIPADLIVCGTGFDQQVPFLSPALTAQIQDTRGNFVLYRHILPPDVPQLTFAGYNSSFFSPLGAEMAAAWIAAHLLGSLSLPTPSARRAQTIEQLRWMETFSEGKHARGTSVIPFSMHNIHEVLQDLLLDVGPLTKARQWLLPVDPATYRKVGPALLQRHGLLE
ncbi:flavin-containing monooxygenase [Kineosporia babensis]|uniref:NAD(P)/FAD-dependent oxidoreductase n=1 Tax=Kineosporia babensis TaxID=499548 RepID=A0A9X1NCK2_9ACTN|nr:NAD(P)/FAD-dependent oxidoreductase [Kineosporia babensis]MCD5311281.1 NAD(P)/FAD-dependent oxidoreductase [Kineosporia babensis]